MKLIKLILVISPVFGAIFDQAVADQAAPIFGLYKPCVGSLCSYMAGIDDSTLLSDLNLAGTHDCATWNYTQATQDSYLEITGPIPPAFFFHCQSQTINGFVGMLQAGVRVFDLRVGYSPDGQNVTFYHSSAMLSPTATLDDVLYMFYVWLTDNPTESLILTIKVEHGTIDRALQEMIYNSLNSQLALSFFVQESDTIVTLGEARGKITLFRRFDYNFLPSEFSNRYGLAVEPEKWEENGANSTIAFSENESLYIEDYYSIGGPMNVESKIQYKYNATSLHLDFARSYGKELFISFASAEANVNIPPVYPKIMALGCPITHAEGMNSRLLSFFQDPIRNNSRFGIVMLDFVDPSTNLIRSILQLGDGF